MTGKAGRKKKELNLSVFQSSLACMWVLYLHSKTGRLSSQKRGKGRRQ